MKTEWSTLTTKFFFLELKRPEIGAPTADDVCNTIEDYARGSDLEVVFISRESPVKFYLNNTVYSTKKTGSAGSPIVLCYQDN